MKKNPNSIIQKLLILILPLIFLTSVSHASPTEQPLLQPEDVSYLGSFTLPSSFGAEVRGLGLSADGTQLYVGQYPSNLGLVTIPSLGSQATAVISPKSVPGNVGLDCGAEAAELSGILVHNDKLILSKRCYFVTSPGGGNTHLTADLNITNFSSMKRIPASGSVQYANGWMGGVPAEWQNLLGGPAFAGNSMMSIVSTNSVGPSFYVFNPDDVSTSSSIPSTPLMLFPFSDNQSTNMMNIDPTKPNDYLVRSDQANAGMIFPSGTRSVLFFYRHGNSFCYGTAEQCGNDQCSPYHGEHGYPYQRNIMAFDANELLAVKNGSMAYHEVEPYDVWEAPDAQGNCDGYMYSAIAYDDKNRKVYVGTSDRKIHVYKIAEGATSPGGGVTPPSDTTPAVRSNGSPTNLLPAGTSQTTMSLTTNENATCRWSTSSNTSYASMTNTFTNTGGTTHSTLIRSLTDGSTYSRYVRCIDSNGVVNTNDYEIRWNVAASSAPSGRRVVNVNNLSGLYAAFSSLQDGDEIVIAPGTYNLNTTQLVINAKNVTVRGSTGNRNDVVIRGDAMTAGANIKTVFYFPQGPNGQNAVIKDLSVGRVGWHAIMFNGNGAGNGSTIDNVRLFDSYEQLLKSTVNSSGSDNITVKRSLFEYTAGIGPQYYIGGVDTLGSEDWTIQDNVFQDIESPSGSISNPAIHLWSNSTFAGNMLVERNKIINCDRGIGIWNGIGTNVVRNNMVVSDGSNRFSDVGIDIQNTPNTKVYNNSVWIEGSYPNAIELRGAATVNSLVVNNLTSKRVYLFNGASGTTSNNIENAQASWFVNTATGDLHLSPGANRVVDAGIPVTGLADDFDGQTRPSSITIGADQRSTTIAPPGNLRIL